MTSQSGEITQIQNDNCEFDTFEKLNELLAKEKTIKIELVNLKEFKAKLKELSKAEEECKGLINKYQDESNGQFFIKDKKDLNLLVKAMGEFDNQNITCASFKIFKEKMLPYVYWFNKATKLIKNYSRALGVKSNQLNLIDCIDMRIEDSPYEKLEGNYKVLISLNEKLSIDRFKFFRTIEEGIYIK